MMSRNSSASIRPSTSSMCVRSVMSGRRRCARSPSPVSVTACTSWPAARSGPSTRRQIQAPPQAPCTSTNGFICALQFGVARQPVVQRRARHLQHLGRGDAVAAGGAQRGGDGRALQRRPPGRAAVAAGPPRRAAGAGRRAARSAAGEKCAACSTSSSCISAACSSTLRSSRMLPGQGSRASSSSASGAGCAPAGRCAARCLRAAPRPAPRCRRAARAAAAAGSAAR